MMNCTSGPATRQKKFRPGSGVVPFLLGQVDGDPQRFGHLIVGKAGEMMVFDNLSGQQIFDSEPIQGSTVHSKDPEPLKHDSDLSGIRDTGALAKLPADEQKAFNQLWADVAALLKKAEEKPE
jgi:hypothetical protein